MTISILLVDDNPTFLGAVLQLLAIAMPEMTRFDEPRLAGGNSLRCG